MAQSLFGLTPDQIQEARRLQQQQAINQQAQQFGMFGPLYAAGRGMAQQGISQLASLFPDTQQDPMLQRATATQSIIQKYQGQDFNDPAVLSKMAGDFSAAGQPEIAMQLGDRAKALTPKVSRTVVAPGSSVIDEQGNVLFTAPKEDKESIVKTNEATARAAGELGFGVRPNLSDYSPKELAAINNLLQVRGENIQAAGRPAPESGRVPISDLSTATQIVDRFTKGPQEKLATARDARSQLILAKRGEGAAFSQLKRQLVKLVGDSQIGMGEVRDALGSAGIVGDTISAVNQFMTGVPTADKLDSVEKVINALERINAESYNQGRIRARDVLSEGALKPQTVNSLIPPEYKLNRGKPSEFQTGKVYKDAKGNRAKYLGNGKWEPIQ
jgi:hypothetical protein